MTQWLAVYGIVMGVICAVLLTLLVVSACVLRFGVAPVLGVAAVYAALVAWFCWGLWYLLQSDKFNGWSMSRFGESSKPQERSTEAGTVHRRDAADAGAVTQP